MADYFRDNNPEADLGKKSMRGGVALMASRVMAVFFQLGSSIILARLVSPHDYGLVAMVSAIVGFAPMLIELGTSDAAVQKHRITPDEVSALFWLNCIIGCGLALLIVGCSSLIAWFYHEPELQNIAMVSALTFIFSSISCQHYALLRRAMRFNAVATIDVSANFLSTLAAIGMALAGWGYWALVAKTVLCTMFAAIGVWCTCRWLPGRPRLTDGVKEMLKFGLNVTGFTTTDYLGRSADRVGLGYFYGASPLGFFQNAVYVYDSLLGLLTLPLHSVAVSSLSKLRENLAELRRAWSTALAALCFFAMPAFCILSVTSQDVVDFIFGARWEPAAPLLAVFAVRGIAHVVERTLGWLHVAAGRSDRWMRWGLLSSVIQLVALAGGLPFGAYGVAVSYTLATFALFVPALAYAGRPLGIKPFCVIKAVGPQMVAALIAVAVGHWLRLTLLSDLSGITRMALLGCVCAVIYLLIAVGMFRIIKPLRVLVSLIRAYLPVRWTRWGRQPAQSPS